MTQRALKRAEGAQYSREYRSVMREQGYKHISTMVSDKDAPMALAFCEMLRCERMLVSVMEHLPGASEFVSMRNMSKVPTADEVMRIEEWCEKSPQYGSKTAVIKSMLSTMRYHITQGNGYRNMLVAGNKEVRTEALFVAHNNLARACLKYCEAVKNQPSPLVGVPRLTGVY